MDEKLCDEKHDNINKQFEVIERRLNDHSDSIKKLAISDATNTAVIQQLCKKLDALTASMWGLTIVLAGGFITFFFYAVQTKIFQ